MEYYSAIKRNEVLIHVTKWIKLENMLSEKKTVTKGHILYYPIYMKCPAHANL